MASNVGTLKMQGIEFDPAIKKLFKSTKAAAIATKNLKTVALTDSAAVVMKVLNDAHISSVPVVDAGNAPIGFVDVLDMTHFVLSCLTDKPPTSESGKRKLKFDSGKWKKATAVELMNLSRRNPFIVVRDTADLTQVIKALISAGHGHRALVTDENGKPVGVISQGDIVKLFWKSVDNYDVAKKTVKDLKFGFCEVNRALNSDSAYDGFERLKRRNISGLAITTDDGHTLYGNLSGSDIKNLGDNPEKSWERLKLTIQSYLEDHSAQDRPVFVLQSDTISQVAHKFAKSHVHRLFVADHAERMNLIGVISLSDVIRMLYISASQKSGSGSGVSRRKSTKSTPSDRNRRESKDADAGPDSPKATKSSPRKDSKETAPKELKKSRDNSPQEVKK